MHIESKAGFEERSLNPSTWILGWSLQGLVRRAWILSEFTVQEVDSGRVGLPWGSVHRSREGGARAGGGVGRGSGCWCASPSCILENQVTSLLLLPTALGRKQSGVENLPNRLTASWRILAARELVSQNSQSCLRRVLLPFPVLQGFAHPDHRFLFTPVFPPGWCLRGVFRRTWHSASHTWSQSPAKQLLDDCQQMIARSSVLGFQSKRSCLGSPGPLGNGHT